MNGDQARDRLALALDVDDLVVALRLARPPAAVLRGGEGRARAVLGGRPEAVSALTIGGLPGLSRPEAARHPHDCGAGGPGARRARRRLTSRCTPGGGEPMVRAAVEGMAEGAAAAGARNALCARRHGPHERPRGAAERARRRAARSLRPRAVAAWCAPPATSGRHPSGRHRASPPWCRGSDPPGPATDDQARTATPAAAITARGRHPRHRSRRDRRPIRTPQRLPARSPLRSTKSQSMLVVAHPASSDP